jgi:two-component system chemotaxis sensor kinase CheA
MSSKKNHVILGIGGNTGNTKRIFQKLFLKFQGDNRFHILSTSPLLKNDKTTYEEFKNIIDQNEIRTWLDDDLKILEDILDESVLKNEELLKIARSTIDNLESKIKTLTEFTKENRKVTYEEILDDVVAIKKKPLTAYLSSYIQLTKQLAQKLNKPINQVQMTGTDTIYVNESIKPFVKTLVHIFRNSIDHGIESIEERLARGKKETATILCTASKDDQNISIKISDDGKGIDENIIAAKAVEKGIYTTEQLTKMDKNQILLTIFEDSFSTKDTVTALSGRGIGLGAVKQECELLGGTVTIDSIVNKGTTFTFTLPANKV